MQLPAHKSTTQQLFDLVGALTAEPVLLGNDTTGQIDVDGRPIFALPAMGYNTLTSFDSELPHGGFAYTVQLCQLGIVKGPIDGGQNFGRQRNFLTSHYR